jgi:hypothetical protein
MPTTTNYGWTTPADTDLVSQGAAAIRTLGSSIDTTTKNLNPQTTTGAIAYRSATSNVNTSLAIGTAGQVLTVNSGATAPEWATPATGSPPQNLPLSQNAYFGLMGTTAAGTQGINGTEDTTYYVPIYLPVCTVDRIGIRTGTNWSATTADIRLGIYNNGASNTPTTVLLDAGTVQTSAASTTYEITVSQSIIYAGWYWLASNFQVGVGVSTVAWLGVGGAKFTPVASSLQNQLTNSHSSGFSQSSVTGAFATATSLTFATGNLPSAVVRIN